MKINASQWKIDENQCKSVEIDDFCLQIATKIRELEDWRIQWMGIRSRKLLYDAKISTKRGPGAPRPRTVGRAGATGKGREGVILSILDTWKLRSCFMVPKYRNNGSGGFQPGKK